MGFKDRSFEQPDYTEKEQIPERAIIISCEGKNTEPQYFKIIKDKFSDHMSALLEIKIVPRDTKSAPKYVLSDLQGFIEEKYDCKKGHDQMWLVLDREKTQDRKQAILDILPECKEKYYNIALTNPAFEFWLLLHVVNIQNYNENDLFQNIKINNSKRFLEKQLSDELGGYNKSNLNPNIVTEENIKRALKQEQLFENDLENIIDNLGSNVGDLVKEILPSFITLNTKPVSKMI